MDLLLRNWLFRVVDDEGDGVGDDGEIVKIDGAGGGIGTCVGGIGQPSDSCFVM
jgi:hypothetical protein